MTRFAIKFLTQLAEELAQERATLADEIIFRRRRMLDTDALDTALNVTVSRYKGVMRACEEIKAATTRGARDSGGIPKAKKAPKSKSKKTDKTDKADEAEHIMRVATKLLSP